MYKSVTFFFYLLKKVFIKKEKCLIYGQIEKLQGKTFNE